MVVGRGPELFPRLCDNSAQLTLSTVWCTLNEMALTEWHLRRVDSVRLLPGMRVSCGLTRSSGVDIDKSLPPEDCSCFLIRLDPPSTFALTINLAQYMYEHSSKIRFRGTDSDCMRGASVPYFVVSY